MVHQHHRTPHTVHQHHRRMRHLLSGRSRMPSRSAFHTVVRFVRRVRVPPPCVSDVRRVRCVPTILRSWNSSPTTHGDLRQRQYCIFLPPPPTAATFPAHPYLGIFCTRKIIEVFFPFFFWLRVDAPSVPSLSCATVPRATFDRSNRPPFEPVEQTRPGKSHPHPVTSATSTNQIPAHWYSTSVCTRLWPLSPMFTLP
jgi:hypothetical protein